MRVLGATPNGETPTFTGSNGEFTTLVGGGAYSGQPLMLTCGQQYNLQISVCSLTNNGNCYDTNQKGTWADVGTYGFTACYGTQGDFNVPGKFRVGGNTDGPVWAVGITGALIQRGGDVSLGADKSGNVNVGGNLVVGGKFSPKITRQITKNEYGQANYNANKDTELGNWDICFLTKVMLEPVDEKNQWGGCELKITWQGDCLTEDKFSVCKTNIEDRPLWKISVQDNNNWAMCGVTCMNFGP
jgi:hypothetical protein